MKYSLYGNLGHISLDALKDENAATGCLFARAEHSGCEGCYVEVAKWNESTRRYERYAFEKYFGGEHPEDTDSAGVYGYAVDTAERFAADINNAAGPGGSTTPLIHTLPNFGEQPIAPELLAACKAAEAYALVCGPDDFGRYPLKQIREAIAKATATV